MEQVIKLKKMLLSFSPGDLIAGVEIQDLLKVILSNKTLSGKERKILTNISEEFDQVLSLGISVNIGDSFNKFINQLEIIYSFPEENAEKDMPDDSILIEEREILDSFIMEAKEHLDGIEEKILQLEKNKDSNFVNAIFRSMHTIKGVASFIGLRKIKDLSHKLESVLDSLRKDEISVETKLIDYLLEGIDLLNIFVNDIASKAEKEKDRSFILKEFDLDTDDFIVNMDAYFQSLEDANGQQVRPMEFSHEDLISDEMIEKFVQESTDLLDDVETTLLELEKKPGDRSLLDSMFRNIHTLKGNAGFFWFKSIEKICMNMETLLDTYRKIKEPIDQRGITTLLGATDEISQQLQQISKGEKLIADSEETTEDVKGFKPLGDLLVDMGVATREAVDGALELQQMKLGELLVHEGIAKEADIQTALKNQGKSGDISESISNYSVKRKDIRVDTERLDKLFNLMGELITAEAMVINNPELRELDLPDFQRAASYMSKISREMQEITMAIRMIPLEGLFNKMRRLVRDLSRKFNKEIDFYISGEETEMDRNVMEEISDPLVHIIRNAIDHGIEASNIRKKREKTEAGSIELSARYEGNEIWISIKDDGGGLNKEKILSKAIAKELISDDKDMPDSDIWQLIFEPGFSTADQVSEISGRGVGMDVVRKNIDKLRGKIDVKSQDGLGTEIILKIPLTLAIIDGINFRVGAMIYSVPINDVIQFHKPTAKQLTISKSSGIVLNLRNELIPVISIADFFRVHSKYETIEDAIFIIVSGADKKVAIAVDEIIGYKQLVVKALPEYMGSLRAISGCSILGDGNVSLIMDTGSFINEVLE